MDATPNYVTAFISSGVIVALISAAAQVLIAARKQGADAPGQLTDSAMKIVNELQEEVARLRQQLRELEEKVTWLESEWQLALATIDEMDRSKADKLRRDARGRFVARKESE